jgi:hypothetical protein
MDRDVITIVSGLPRSGTSMMMKMLEAGGLEPVVDHIRTPDEDNPKGYYEFERVKALESDREWLPEAHGKFVKVISMLLRHLPADHRYKVIFMQRSMPEVLASQKKMLVRRGEDPNKVPDDKMSAMFEGHLKKTYQWLGEQPNLDVLYVNYNEMVASPAEGIRRVDAFLGGGLDTAAMAGVVDKDLYRNRG